MAYASSAPIFAFTTESGWSGDDCEVAYEAMSQRLTTMPRAHQNEDFERAITHVLLYRTSPRRDGEVRPIYTQIGCGTAQFRLRSLLHDSVVLPEKRLETDPTSVLRIMYQFVTCTIGVEPGYAYDP